MLAASADGRLIPTSRRDTVSLQTQAIDQNESFTASCMMRAGSELLITPACGVPMIALGALKLARLNALKASPRTFRPNLSLIRNTRTTPRSTLK
jgi:hypothetical protein